MLCVSLVHTKHLIIAEHEVLTAIDRQCCCLPVFFFQFLLLQSFQTTYKVTAFATAEEYHLEYIAREAQKYGYTVVQLPEGFSTCTYIFILGNMVILKHLQY